MINLNHESVFGVADLTLANHPYSLRDAIEHAGRRSVIVRFFGGGIMAMMECYVAYDVILMYNIRHRHFIRQCYSYEERIDLRWVTVSIVCFDIFALIAFVRHTHANIVMRYETGKKIQLIFLSQYKIVYLRLILILYNYGTLS